MLSLARPLAFTVLTLGLAACSMFRPPPPTPHPPVVAAPVVMAPPEPPPIPLRKPPVPRSAAASVAATPPPTEIAKLEPPSPPPPDEQSAPNIVGLDQTALQASLGSPDTRRDAPPAEVWQYVDGDCTIDVYLYRDVESGAQHALYVDVKGDDQSDQRRQSCIRRFAQRTAMGQRDSGAGSPAAR